MILISRKGCPATGPVVWVIVCRYGRISWGPRPSLSTPFPTVCKSGVGALFPHRRDVATTHVVCARRRALTAAPTSLPDLPTEYGHRRSNRGVVPRRTSERCRALTTSADRDRCRPGTPHCAPPVQLPSTTSSSAPRRDFSHQRQQLIMSFFSGFTRNRTRPSAPAWLVLPGLPLSHLTWSRVLMVRRETLGGLSRALGAHAGETLVVVSCSLARVKDRAPTSVPRETSILRVELLLWPQQSMASVRRAHTNAHQQR